MNAVAKMRQAGFLPALSPAGGLLIEPASKLTPEQRAYIRAHKVLLLEALRAEMTPVASDPPPLTVAFDQDAFEERAAILEFEAGFSRDEAERRARALMSAENLAKLSIQAAPEKSDRQLAKAIGVSHHTVKAQRDELEGTGQIAQLDRTVGADGKERPRQVDRKAEPAQRPISITVAKPDKVCCADCAHSVLPPDTCPVYGWRLCAAGGFGGFARAVQQCGNWEAR